MTHLAVRKPYKQPRVVGWFTPHFFHVGTEIDAHAQDSSRDRNHRCKFGIAKRDLLGHTSIGQFGNRVAGQNSFEINKPRTETVIRSIIFSEIDKRLKLAKARFLSGKREKFKL